MKIKQFLLSGFLLTVTGLYAQSPCNNGRYANDVFSSVTLTSNITYGQNRTFSNANKILKLDFYEPTGDTAQVRPLIIWAHSGSFLQGSKTDPDMVDLANAFVKKGFVCASIDYRTGFYPVDSVNSIKAVMRAVQDMRAAIRFFYMDRAENINTFRIDTNNIFIGGSSAGAIASLHLTNLDRTCEFDSYIDSVTLVSLGGLEGNSGNPCYSDEVKGVINLCGALAQYGWLEAGAIPFCSMHGTEDATVNYSRGIVNPGVPLMYIDGSRMLHEQAIDIGVKNPFYTFYGADHVPFYGPGTSAQAYLDTTVNFVRDFLVDLMGCSESPLQTANTPYGTASLYSMSACSDNFVIDWCALAGEDENILDDFRFYPNPATDNVTIVIGETVDRYTISLVDHSGRLLLTRTSDQNTILLNTNDVHPGTYLLIISDSKGYKSTKQIIFTP